MKVVSFSSEKYETFFILRFIAEVLVVHFIISWFFEIDCTVIKKAPHF